MIRLAAAFLLFAGLAAPAAAQGTGTTNMEILRQKIQADRKLLIAQNLELTDAEGAKFWPVYEAYQKDLQQINQRLETTILAYAEAYKKGPIGDDAAKKLLGEALAIDEAELKLRTSAVPKVMAVLPATKAARYIQMENKIRAVVRYELAAGIPLVK
jgi:Spy/CpxP family protein refolding chaperone